MADTVNKSYGFSFRGINESKLVETLIPVGQFNVDELLGAIKTNIVDLQFIVHYGVIKELLYVKGYSEVSKVGTDKFQAFILKRKEDTITQDDNKNYFVNGKQIILSFSGYNVSIVEI